MKAGNNNDFDRLLFFANGPEVFDIGGMTGWQPF
jgi:hypothetical protein